MPDKIVFYFDFASPYAYFALDRIEALGRKAGRAVEWRPVLAWAIFKELGIAAPTEVPAKRDYIVRGHEALGRIFRASLQTPREVAGFRASRHTSLPVHCR